MILMSYENTSNDYRRWPKCTIYNPTNFFAWSNSYIDGTTSKTHYAVKTYKKVTTLETRIDYASGLELVDEFDGGTVPMPA